MQAFTYRSKGSSQHIVPTPPYLRRPLEVLVVATHELFARLRGIADDAGVHLTMAHNAPALYKQASGREHDLVLLQWGDEPDDARNHPGGNALLDRLLIHARHPIVLYAPLTADSARSLLRTEHLKVSGVAFRGVDDVSEIALQRVLYESDAAFVSISLARSVISHSGAWSRRLREAVAHALIAPATYRSIDAIAEESDLARRSVDRAFARCGLATAATLLRCARAAVAYGRLRYGLTSWDGLVAVTGARSNELLLSDIRFACALDSARDLGALQAEEVLRRLEATASSITPRSVDRPA